MFLDLICFFIIVIICEIVIFGLNNLLSYFEMFCLYYKVSCFLIFVENM